MKGNRSNDFMAGHYRFGGDGSSAGVSNEGVITIGRGGYAALIGGTVKNDGMIAVPMGKVGLGSGEQATLDLSGDGFLQVAVPTADGAEGTGALIENGGRISAEGGTVVMQAATARHTARHAINLSGTVEANSVSGRDGAIVIGGGEGGEVSLSGRLSSQSSSGTGGNVTVTGKSVALKGATVDASGATGGGTVRIGGDYKGQGALQRAATTTVDAASTIRADATQSGDGGSIVVWSDDLTRFSGLITAMGAGSGRGGDAEVSGKARLAYTGFANLSGPGGFGTLLLDPYNITILGDADSNLSGFSASGNNSVLNVTTLTNALAGANVAVTTGTGGSQTGNIAVNSAISWAANTTLTLSAANNIAINADITATGAQAGLVLNYGDYANTGSATSGTDYSIASGASITLSGANSSLAINGTGYTLIRSRADLEAVNSNLGGAHALNGDLDLSGVTYTQAVIAARGSQFTGSFAGLGHLVSDLTINSAGNFVGLFGTNSGSIRDLGIVGGSVSGQNIVGALVGGNDGGTLNNVYATATVLGADMVGGLVGNSVNGTISNAYATGAVSGADMVGGLMGFHARGTISNAYATGAVSGAQEIGGLVGYHSGGTISTAYATGAVSGANGVGGLVGNGTNGTITDAYATGAVIASGFIIGGLVGSYANGTISNAYATGAVSGVDRVGGLVGVHFGGAISTSYATGVVSGRSSVGGLVGWSQGGLISNAQASGVVTGSGDYVGGVVGFYEAGTISNVYATGAVSGGLAVGELLGSQSGGTISNAYATGAVIGNDFVGGVVGFSGGVTITASFFNSDTTGQADGVGAGSSTGVTGLTTAQMSDLSIFAAAGWDIDGQGGTGTIWRIYDGYTAPLIRSLLTSLTVTTNDVAKTYDGLAFTGNNGVRYSGFVNGDNASVLGGTLSFGGTSQGALNAGTYTLTASGLYSTLYDISYVDGALTVNRSGLTVTANNDTKTYDGLAYTGGNGVSYSGFVNGETASVLGGALNFGGTSQGALNAGSYVLSASGFTSGNYDISYVGGILTVTPASLTITADSSPIVSGSSIPSLGYSTAGWRNGQDGNLLSGVVVSTDATSSSGAGRFATRAANGTLSGAAAGNYRLIYVDGVLTVTPQLGAQLLQTVVLPFNPAINFAASLDTRSGFSPSSPIIGAVASGSGGNGGAGGAFSVEDPLLSGAVCALGPNLAIAC